MTITLDPELEAALKDAAARRGLTPEALAHQRPADALPHPRFIQPRDEWERGLLDVAIDCGVSLPDWALGRDAMYD